jgi:biopolymer transport protein ExbD/DNA-directed RNA polymerase subunit RPC12/RpoP
MSVEFSCTQCGSELRADGRHIGRRVRCPDCATLIVVPNPHSAEQESIVELEAVDEAPAVALEPVQSPVEQPPQPPSPPPPILAAPPKRSAEAGTAPPAPSASTPPQRSDEPSLLVPSRAPPEDLIDMTAMVDIVFFLLIFFLVTSLQSLESVMNMPTPQASEGGVSTARSVADLENDPNFITVRIEDGDLIWVEDTQVFNDQELARRLLTARNETDRPRGLLVIGDADASHGAAVRVFDAGAAAGVSGISLIVQEQSEGNR